MLDHSIHNLGSVQRWAREDVENAGGESCVIKRLTNGPVAARRQLRRLQYSTVPCSNGSGSGADTKDKRGIPAQLSV